MRRAQSTVETMMLISAPLVAIVLAGWLAPDRLHALVVAIGEWVATLVELP